MLYQINLPNSTQYLEWIVQFQSDLLHALCNPTVNAPTVTVDWVKQQRQDIDDGWMNRFCRWKKDGKSMLERMKAIARLSQANKLAIIIHYKNNLRYIEAFIDGQTPPPKTTPLPHDWVNDTASIYRNFFEMFYNPIFYNKKGYPIQADDLDGQLFTKDNYLKAYRNTNSNIDVCLLCDGGMDGCELDHWLPKTNYFPELNCHPQNLIEICKNCNSVTTKGEHLAMDEDEDQPFAKWLHPHLRSAEGNFRLEKQDFTVRLVSDDEIIQQKLDNFGKLIKLGSRWFREWKTQEKIVKKHIRRYVNQEHLDDVHIRTKIEDLKRNIETEIGLEPHSLVKICFLDSVLDENSSEFEELSTYAQDCRAEVR